MQGHMLEKLNQLLPTEKLNEFVEQHKEAYNLADPYPHVVLDNVFDEEVLREIISEFDIASEKWKSYETKYEKKMQMSSDQDFGLMTRFFLYTLNSQPFLQFLEEMTGVKSLLPDMSYAGGGLHSIPTGGKLGVHVDFNFHQHMEAFRRINVIIYLNDNWQEEYGGAFELWDADRTQCQKKVYPMFNRMVIFNTTSTSYHGHPHPLTCPEDVTRKSLALYYYTSKDRGAQSKSAHSTIFINEKGGKDELGKASLITRLKRRVKQFVVK